ncbi:MAG: glycosyltransferase family 39 protein, partial [Chitinophagales bacterium]
MKRENVNNKTALISISIFVLLLGLTRLLFSTGIEIDESEQSYLSQWLLLGYDIQPPLYTWTNIALIEVFGNHHWVYVFFRMVLMLMSYYGLFLIFSRMSQNKKIGFGAVIFSLFLAQFSTESLRHTHTVLVTVASIWSMVYLERIWQKPQWKYYVLLGFTLAMGILSKYNFLIFMSSVCLALLLLPKGRSILITSKTLVTLFITASIIGPHFTWIWQNIWELAGGVSSDLGSTSNDSMWMAKVLGLQVLLVNLLSFLSVFLVAFGLTHFRRLQSASQTKSEWIAFFEYFFLLVIGQLVFAVLIFNATIFHERWMQPFFVFFPGYCLLKCYPYSIPSKTWKLFQRMAYLASATILIIVVMRIAVFPYFFQKTIRLNLPHEQFCEDLQPIIAKNDIDLIVTDEVLLGGYLSMVFPETVVIVQEPKYAMVNLHAFGKNKNALLVWTWSWRTHEVHSAKKIPPSLQSLLETYQKERIAGNRLVR